MSDDEPGLRPLSAALEDEGFEDFSTSFLVESFARHLMVHVDAWQEFGFPAIAKRYLPRLEPEQGVRRDIDDNGDLLVRRTGKTKVERRSLIQALAAPRWLDPATRGPK
jgi:hypothetical protein